MPPKPGAKKAVKSKPATLTDCATGVEVVEASEASVSNLTVVAPTATGLLAEASDGGTFSNINVPMHSVTSGIGFVLEGGTDNLVKNSTVDSSDSEYGFIAGEETADTFLHDAVNDPYSSSGTNGTYSAVMNAD